MAATLLAACGERDARDAASRGVSDERDRVSQRSIDARPVEVEQGLLNPRPVPWHHVESRPADDSATVFYSGGVPECFGLARVDIRVRGGAQIITLYEGRREEARGRPCREIAIFKKVEVAVSSERLVDGAR